MLMLKPVYGIPEQETVCYMTRDIVNKSFFQKCVFPIRKWERHKNHIFAFVFYLHAQVLFLPNLSLKRIILCHQANLRKSS